MNINNVIAKAQRLMLSENFNRDVERAASAQRGAGINGKRGNDLADLDAAVFGISSEPSGTDIYQKAPIQEQYYHQQPQQNYDGVQIVQEVQEKRNSRNSKIPAAIIESFEKLPYQCDVEANSAVAAYLDNVQQQQQINEQRVPQQRTAPVQNYGGGAVNYDTIKYIVNEAVKEALKGKLNESVSVASFKGMRIADGNVIQFLDNKGNLYEGVLKLKKKATK